MKTENHIKKMLITAMFSAIICVCTMLLKIDLPTGYANLGDSIILLAVWLTGGIYGAFAAGIGSMLADILSGYMVYAPATFVIKFIMGILAFYIFRFGITAKIRSVTARIIAALSAEIFMVFGYFLYEFYFLGFGISAAAMLLPNAMQGVVCIVCGIVLYEILSRNKGFASFFRK